MSAIRFAAFYTSQNSSPYFSHYSVFTTANGALHGASIDRPEIVIKVRRKRKRVICSSLLQRGDGGSMAGWKGNLKLTYVGTRLSLRLEQLAVQNKWFQPSHNVIYSAERYTMKLHLLGP